MYPRTGALFSSSEYTLGSDMRDFTHRLLELKNKPDADRLR
jgi:hypothetical protein